MSGLASGTEQNRRALWIVLGLTCVYLLAAIIAGIFTHSLALLAEAAHMFTDAGALGLSIFAAWIAQKPATPAKTYGYYRVEILAALANALLLLLISLSILVEAYFRFPSSSFFCGFWVIAER